MYYLVGWVVITDNIFALLVDSCNSPGVSFMGRLSNPIMVLLCGWMLAAHHSPVSPIEVMVHVLLATHL